MALQQIQVCFDVVAVGEIDRALLEGCIEMAFAVYVDGYVFGSAYVASVGDRESPLTQGG